MNSKYYLLKRKIKDTKADSEINFLHFPSKYGLLLENIPQSVKSLHFCDDCTFLLTELPSNITQLHFYKNTKLCNNISNFVKVLWIDKCDSPLYYLLPDKLEVLWVLEII